jgi:thiosulfate/3-mercaptopyruvate sulfurtransferase
MKYGRIPQLVMATGLATFALLFGSLQCPAKQPIPTSGPGSALSIPQAQLIQPEALNRLLQAKGADKPLVLQVGSHLLFDEAHILGSVYAGAGSQPTGLQQLQSTVATVSKKKAIVLYCGCCPWNRCPNLGPAFKQLQDLGFTNVKALYLADNLGTDWVAEGYPVERSH